MTNTEALAPAAAYATLSRVADHFDYVTASPRMFRVCGQLAELGWVAQHQAPRCDEGFDAVWRVTPLGRELLARFDAARDAAVAAVLL